MRVFPAGAAKRGEENYQRSRRVALDLGDELQLKLGAWVAILPETIDVSAEVGSATSIGAPFHKAAEASLELTVGINWHAVDGLDVLAGAGFGLTEGYATPDYRVFAGVRFSVLPPRDRDGDGYFDDHDSCHDDSEDFDGFGDAEGCPDPDPDNDKDGVFDLWVMEQGKTSHYAALGVGSDGCPDDPVDRDEFEDADGCPDPDNDVDGVCDPWGEGNPRAGIPADCIRRRLRGFRGFRG